MRTSKLQALVTGDRVEVKWIGKGTIIKVRDDGRGVPLFDIRLDDKDATPDGSFVARESELLPVGKETV